MWRNGITHTSVVEKYKMVSPLENSLLAPFKIRNGLTIQPRNCTLGHLSQKNKNLFSYNKYEINKEKFVHKCSYKSFIHNSFNLETTSMSFSG